MSDAGWRPEAPDAGILAIIFGTIFSLVVGTGVMTLVFYDDRRRLAFRGCDRIGSGQCE